MSHHWGYVAAIVSAILFAAGSTQNKIALKNVNPTVVVVMIYFVAGILLNDQIKKRLIPQKSRTGG